MNIVNAKKWSAELRSGKYKQIKGALKKNDGFCCLGIAYECLIGPILGNYSDDEMAYPKLCNILGIEGTTKYWELNDLKGKSFNEIADVVDGDIAAQERFDNRQV